MATTTTERVSAQPAMLVWPWFLRNRTALALVAALMAGWLGHGLFAAPADVPQITLYDGWKLICPARTAADQPCMLTEDVTDPKTGLAMVRFSITDATADQAAKIDVLVPSNVLIQSKLALKFDDQPPRSFDYRTCNRAGCLTTIPADAALYGAVTSARKIQVTYTNLSGKSVPYAVPMKSFDEAVSAMNDAEAKRHSWLRRVLL